MKPNDAIEDAREAIGLFVVGSSDIRTLHLTLTGAAACLDDWRAAEHANEEERRIIIDPLLWANQCIVENYRTADEVKAMIRATVKPQAFAIWVPWQDLSLAYLDEEGDLTTRHPDARLWSTRGEVDAAKSAYIGNADPNDRGALCGIEAVYSVSRFQARMDTW